MGRAQKRLSGRMSGSAGFEQMKQDRLDPLPGEDQASWGSCFDVTVCVLPPENVAPSPAVPLPPKFGLGDEGGEGAAAQVLGWLEEGWGVGVLPAGN